MVTLNKLYTRTGDQGETGLVDGSRVAKDSVRVAAYGEVDELNSQLGLIRTMAEQAKLAELTQQLSTIQNELFDIGSALATPSGFTKYKPFQVNAEHISRLEKWIDAAVAQTPELKSFVLPGGTLLNAQLHIARAVCRRAERSLITLHRDQPTQELQLVYINRLSDLLFAWARVESKRNGATEYLWQPSK